MAVSVDDEAVLRVIGTARLVSIAAVSGPFSVVAGFHPLLGAGFSPGEGRTGERVAVLDYNFWVRQLAGNSTIVGSSIDLDNSVYRVVGVMPKGFAFPPASVHDIWVPAEARLGPIWTNADAKLFSVVGRLRTPAGWPQLQQEMETVRKRAYPSDPAALEVSSVVGELAQPAKRGLFLLLSAMLAVLGLACLNATGVLFARSLQDKQTIAILQSFGASNFEVLALRVISILPLAVSAGFLSSAATPALAMIFARVNSMTSAVAPPLSLSSTVASASFITAFLAAILIAALVALQDCIITDPRQFSGTTSLMGSRATRRTAKSYQAVVASQLCLSISLAFLGVILIEFFVARSHAALGFSPTGVYTLRCTLPQERYMSAEARSAFYATAADRYPELAFTNNLPFGGQRRTSPFFVTGAQTRGQMAQYTVVSPSYFNVMKIQVLQGRGFLRSDDARHPPVAIVDSSFARQFLKPSDVGFAKVKTFFGEQAWRLIVGVVDDTRHDWLSASGRPTIYVPVYQDPPPAAVALDRISSTSQPRILSRQVSSIDPAVGQGDLTSLEDFVYNSLERPRFYAWVSTFFTFCAVLLLASGVYGLMSYTVRMRLVEIGVRAALGARPGQIVTDILAPLGRPALIGTALGLGCCLALPRVVSSLGVTSTHLDIVTFAGVLLLIVASVCIALIFPIRRAASVSPASTLRQM